jgi:hypothetical protein
LESALVALGCGIACLCWAAWQAIRARHATRWHTAQGRIRAAHTEDHEALEGDISEPEALRVRYVYEVEGRLYSGSRIFFGDRLVPASASYYASRLDPGATVTVHYDPRDPSESVLETRAHPMLGRTIRLAIACFVAAPLFLWLERASTFLRGTPLWLVALLTIVLVARILTKKE